LVALQDQANPDSEISQAIWANLEIFESGPKATKVARSLLLRLVKDQAQMLAYAFLACPA
jgi:hypothetical protein